MHFTYYALLSGLKELLAFGVKKKKKSESEEDS